MSEKLLSLGINIIHYNLMSNDWWKNRSGVLLKTYKNISGDEILKGSKIIIVEKIQFIRQFKYLGTEQILHHGSFSIKDFNFNIIIGVNCYDVNLST